jgi:hypothetical protein
MSVAAREGAAYIVLILGVPQNDQLAAGPVPAGPIRGIYFYPALKPGTGNDKADERNR